MLQTNPPPLSLLTRLLNRTDAFAVETVRAGQGGPFGASIHIFDPGSEDLIEIGGLAANAVLKKGIASAHAENEVLSPENVAELKSALAHFDPETVQVILSSSGQSCPACTAKEEILARRLVDDGLIRAANFFVAYGATYRDTFNVARFNDEVYQVDMRNDVGTGMIAAEEIDIRELPRDIARFIHEAQAPVAIVARDRRILGVGYDTRGEGDLTATAEVNALRAASRAAKSAGSDTPWDLGGATLYTSTADIGPMGYAECQWAKVTTWVSVRHARSKKFETREAAGMGNAELFNVVGHPERYPSDVITTLHIPAFENRAQHEWRRILNAAENVSALLYNGIAQNRDGPA